MKKFDLKILIILMIIFSYFSLAASNETVELEEELKKAENTMLKMHEDGLSIRMYNDTLMLAKEVFDAQILKEERGRKGDYNLVYYKIKELNKIKEDAYKALDELQALSLFINQSEESAEEVILLYNQTVDAFYSERYEEFFELVEDTYQKISEVEAFRAKLKAFYEATSRNLWNYLKESWYIILSIIIILAITYLISHTKIECLIIKRKLENLETRKKVLKKLIAKTQKEYFEEGKISESIYIIRIKKYAEITRDINRQIPLLNEELRMKAKSLKTKRNTKELWKNLLEKLKRLKRQKKEKLKEKS
jgi:hypothetical protein